MTVANRLNTGKNPPVLPTEAFPSGSSPRFQLKSIFVGPDGLRAGWRLLIFVTLVVALFGSSLVIRSGGIQGFREAQKYAGEITITPSLMLKSEAIAFLLLCTATFAMAKIEHRKFSEYGLPLSRVLGKNFWIGASSGFLAISGTLLTMFLLHAFRITGVELHGVAILSSLVAWGIAFLLAGMTEEFLCRGYLQYTLASGIGFWPAALVVSGLFAFGHSFNANETGVGVLATGLFSLLHCLFLQRTGDLWIAIGFHAAWDWGQMLYGVPDSGMLPYHSVFASAFSGQRWLTGGIVGPEGSVLCPIALLIVALIFTRYYRENCYPIQKPQSITVTGS
ncbi:MAG: CPBP family intramembrane glutamic endopeptidase [Candidatus Sulfotelmatobacter sp.]|jgi:membrane protease YdiL (CAAX protease family)